MRRSRVAVVYIHPLFGHGIGQLLRSDKGLDVTCVSAKVEDAHDALLRMQPDAIVFEGSPDDVLPQFLRDLPPSTVIRVGLKEDTMDVYQQHQTVSAEIENLIQAIHAGIR